MSENKVKITVKNHGPIRIEGPITLCDAAGKEYDLGGRTAISLCRCGQTANAPFCDGAHGPCNYQSTVEAKVLPPKA